MRDVLITLIVLGAVPFILARTHIGILMWTWLSLMNPHRLAWGFAYSFPFGAVVAISTLISFLLSNEPKRFPLNAVTIFLILFILWINITTVVALLPDEALAQWSRAIKIQVMVLVSLLVMQRQERIHALAWIIVLSLGFYGLKGGIFTLLTGGTYLVWGPAESFIADNNSLALAVIMTIPLMRYLQLSTDRKWVKFGLGVLMVASTISAIASYSRGAFLAMAAMGFFFWIKSRSKYVVGFALISLALLTLSFMPEQWMSRMYTIETYSQDPSAMGRINSWLFAINLAKDRLFGGGFGAFDQRLFLAYAPDPLDVHAAHSIYFEVLGEHGFIGLGLFIAVMIFAWRMGTRIIKMAKGQPELKWAENLAAMSQVSLIAYAVGGTFLSLAYYDLYYNVVALLVLTEQVIKQKTTVPRRSQKAPSRPSNLAEGEVGITEATSVRQ